MKLHKLIIAVLLPFFVGCGSSLTEQTAAMKKPVRLLQETGNYTIDIDNATVSYRNVVLGTKSSPGGPLLSVRGKDFEMMYKRDLVRSVMDGIGTAGHNIKVESIPPAPTMMPLPCGGGGPCPYGFGTSPGVCDFDATCGDDGNGNASGTLTLYMAYDAGGNVQCNYDFSASTFDCNIIAGGYTGDRNRNLFISYTTLSGSSTLTCSTPGNWGRVFVYYHDARSTGIAIRKWVASNTQIQFMYPRDFPGTGQPLSEKPTSMHTDWYYYGFPAPNFYAGYCNGSS